ncbi:S8 family serine peptidase, partial [Methanoculleus sp.]|uniref:S8 family serine peptidase n=1 Tax=Methanoculleus sp. TaxID=90427 RepID=UPI002BC8259A
MPKGVSVPEAIATYSQNPNVLYAEPNYYRYCDGDPDELKHLDLPAPAPMSGGGGGSGRIPNDPGFGNLWGLHNTGQAIIGINGTVGSDIDAPEAWSITTGSQDVIVAVIDTGVMYTHPDLAANIWRNPGEIPDNGIDDDGNGYIDDVCGWDFYSDDNDPGDLNGHGTHCAGTIAAVGNNALGVAGVMWNATIMPLQFLSPDGYGEDADAILAIQYATMMGADIISCSWGGDDDSQALKDAIDATPALVVCAAGNDALDSDAVPHYPSSYDCANILAVAASNNTERLAPFSNVGATSVDVAAPGASILSTYVIPEWVEVYHDPMDSLDAWDADAPWGLNTTYYTSAPSSADDSPAGKYSPNAEVWLTTKNPIDLQGLQVAELIFDARYDLEDDCDMLYVASSPNGTLYYLHGYLTGSSDGKWYTYGVPLSTYGEDAIYIGFILVTDGSVQKDGVLIDEVRVRGVESVSAGYAYKSGTSMATPHVSGVAGLVRSANASLSATEIKDVIINTADAKPAYAGKMVSGGRVNAYRAVSAVVQAIDPILQSNFTANTTTGTAPLTVQFTDASTGSPNEWFWDFGDNTTSTDQNPIHTYTVPGNYTVSFTVANDHGEDT